MKFSYIGSVVASSLHIDDDIIYQLDLPSEDIGRLRSHVSKNNSLILSTKIAAFEAICLSLCSCTLFRHDIKMDEYHTRCCITWWERGRAGSLRMEVALTKQLLRRLWDIIIMAGNHFHRTTLDGQLKDVHGNPARQRKSCTSSSKTTLKNYNIDHKLLEAAAVDSNGWQRSASLGKPFGNRTVK